MAGMTCLVNGVPGRGRTSLGVASLLPLSLLLLATVALAPTAAFADTQGTKYVGAVGTLRTVDDNRGLRAGDGTPCRAHLPRRAHRRHRFLRGFRELSDGALLL